MMAQDDLSNVEQIAKQLGWGDLWSKGGPGQQNLSGAVPEFSSVKLSFGLLEGFAGSGWPCVDLMCLMFLKHGLLQSQGPMVQYR